MDALVFHQILKVNFDHKALNLFENILHLFARPHP